jgi:hypothetical protein
MAMSMNDLLRQDEFWAFMFALGWVLLSWPMISITVGRFTIFHAPLVLVYIAAVWLLIILLLYLNDWGSSD